MSNFLTDIWSEFNNSVHDIQLFKLGAPSQGHSVYRLRQLYQKWGSISQPATIGLNLLAKDKDSRMSSCIIWKWLQPVKLPENQFQTHQIKGHQKSDYKDLSFFSKKKKRATKPQKPSLIHCCPRKAKSSQPLKSTCGQQ